MELLGIEMPFEEFDSLMCENAQGKELKVIDGKVVAVEHEPTTEEIKLNRIYELKQLLQKYKEDVEQVELFGMERADYEEKKLACSNMILELRELEKGVDNNGN